jgi:hypothetical protein
MAQGFPPIRRGASGVLKQWEKKKDNIFKEIFFVENVALALVVCAMLMLVCLAWRNF